MSENDLRQLPETSGNDGATLGPPPDGKSPRGGAPAGNTNALRHGARSKRRILPLSSLGSAYANVGQYVYRLRKSLEAEVVKVHGHLAVGHEDMISVACRHETVAQIAYRRIALGESTDPLTDAKTAAHATLQRSIAVRKLKLGDDKPPDPWRGVDELLAMEAVQGDDDGADASDDMTEGPDVERPGGASVGDGASDTEGDDSSDLWATVDEAIDRQREEDGA